MQGHGQLPSYESGEEFSGFLLLSLVAASLAGLISQLRAFELKSIRPSSGDIQVSVDKTLGTPTLWFACDGATSDLERMLSQTGVISDLQTLKAGVSLSLSELSEGRAQIVLKLNQAEIPVTAWLSLPGEDGYYLNASNAQAIAGTPSPIDPRSRPHAEFQAVTPGYFEAFGIRVLRGRSSVSRIRLAASRPPW